MQVQPLLTTFHCVPYFMRFKEVKDEPKHCLSPPPLKQFSKSICFQLSGMPLSLSFEVKYELPMISIKVWIYDFMKQG